MERKRNTKNMINVNWKNRSQNYLNEMQKQMANLIAQLHIDLIKYSSEKCVPELWLVGYSELKDKGIFTLCTMYTGFLLYGRAIR